MHLTIDHPTEKKIAGRDFPADDLEGVVFQDFPEPLGASG